MADKKPTEKEFWTYMEAANGIYSRAGKLMAADGFTMTRQAIYDRCTRTEEVKKRLVAIRETIVDKAENVMMDMLDSKDETIAKDAAKFILERLGKDSGYSKRVQHTDGNDEPLSIKVEIVD